MDEYSHNLRTVESYSLEEAKQKLGKLQKFTNPKTGKVILMVNGVPKGTVSKSAGDDPKEWRINVCDRINKVTQVVEDQIVVLTSALEAEDL